MNANGRLATARRRELCCQGSREAYINATTQSRFYILFVVLGNGAIGCEHIVRYLGIIDTAQEYSACRVDRRSAILINVITADRHRFDYCQRDAAEAHDLCCLKQHLPERGLQIVMQAIAADNEISHRIRGTQ